MKTLFILLCLYLSGCATYLPKEDYRQTIIDITNKKYSSLEKIDTRKDYEIYGDSGPIGTLTTGGDQIYEYAAQTKVFIENSEEAIRQAKNLSDAEIGNENYYDIKSQYDELDRGFKKSGFSRYGLRDIQATSSVDLETIRNNYESSFLSYMKRAKSNLSQHKEGMAKERQQEQKKKNAYKESPKYYEDQLCIRHNGILASKERIAEENAAAQHSGMVDKVVLHRLGRRIEIYKRGIKLMGQEYKEKFRKTWNPKDCK